MVAHRCWRCKKLLKEGNEKFYKGFAYGKACYYKVVQADIERESSKRRRELNGKSGQ